MGVGVRVVRRGRWRAGARSAAGEDEVGFPDHKNANYFVPDLMKNWKSSQKVELKKDTRTAPPKNISCASTLSFSNVVPQVSGSEIKWIGGGNGLLFPSEEIEAFCRYHEEMDLFAPE